MSEGTIDATIAVEKDGFYICDLDVELDYTYRPGSKQTYTDPAYGPLVVFHGVKVEGVKRLPDGRSGRKLFAVNDELTVYLLERAQDDEHLIERVCLQEAEDREMDDGR